MTDVLLGNEALWRLGCFAGAFLIVALWEVASPRRRRDLPRAFRWSNNLGLVLLDTLALRVTFPLLAVGMAVLAEERSWGLLHSLGTPLWLAFGVSLLVLDLAIYAQHVAFHAVPPLWRLHRMHHADPELDVTTGVRFHPLEILLSMGVKLSIVALLGAPAAAVLVFEMVLNATSLFNHANVRVPAAFERVLRWVIVTPDMHRVHHSIVPEETDSNFGFNLPWWDRLFGTYRGQPRDGHESMTVGLERFRTRADLRLDRLLVQPWREPGVEPRIEPGIEPSAILLDPSDARLARVPDEPKA